MTMPMPSELTALFARYNQLGAQLPHEDDFDPHDEQELASVTLLLREMAKVQEQINARLKEYASW
jgi:hypothetical protein